MTDKKFNFYDEENKWVPIIGKFLFGFAYVEDVIHQVIKEYLKSGLVGESDLSQNFKLRLDLFERILTEVVLDQEGDVRELKILVMGLKDLWKTRNLVSHNSISYQFEITDDDVRSIDFAISGKRDERHSINYDDLLAANEQLTSYRNRLADLMLKFEYKKMINMYRGQEFKAK